MQVSGPGFGLTRICGWCFQTVVRVHCRVVPGIVPRHAPYLASLSRQSVSGGGAGGRLQGLVARNQWILAGRSGFGAVATDNVTEITGVVSRLQYILLRGGDVGLVSTGYVRGGGWLGRLSNVRLVSASSCMLCRRVSIRVPQRLMAGGRT